MSIQFQEVHIYPTTHKSYLPLSPSVLGSTCSIITDLNVSVKDSCAEKRMRKMRTRYYSVKLRDNNKWKFKGHTPRILITNATFQVSENDRIKIIRTGSKTPHAFIKGTISNIPSLTDNDSHQMLIHTFLSMGAKYIHYCPYRTSFFVISDQPCLPMAPASNVVLPHVFSCRLIYAFETGILGIPNKD